MLTGNHTDFGPHKNYSTWHCCCCCCCFSHSAHWLPTRKRLIYTVANPARGLLNRKKKKKKSGSRPSSTPPTPPSPRAARSEKNKNKIKTTRRIYMSRRYASRCYAGGLGPSRIRTRIPMTRQLGQWVSLRKTLRFRVRLQLSQSRCLSLLLAMSGILFLPLRDHEPPPTLRDRLNPNLSLHRHRFPIPRCAKRPDVALYTVGPFFLLPTPSSTHCSLKVSEHDSL